MRAQKWALVGVAAVALTGCGGGSAAIEPAPGELDFEVAATRMSLDYANISSNIVYEPWSQHFMAPGQEPLEDVNMNETVEIGLDYICSIYEANESDWLRRSHAVDLVQVAINGAVVASASEDFRETYSTAHRYDTNLVSRDDEQIEIANDALELLRTDLRDEWVELYEMQQNFRFERLTVENAQKAELAFAERCGATVDDVVNIDGEQLRPSMMWALSEPAPPIDE